MPLFAGASLRESRCPGCGSSRRTRDVARVLLRLAGARDDDSSPAVLAHCLELLRPLAIFELQAQGALHALLRTLPGYVCSEFLPGLRSGQLSPTGLRCEDVTRLSFADASFDLVISQDVMEHVEAAWQGFGEVARVLKAGGSHVFTVPVHDGRHTRQRAAGQGGNAGDNVSGKGDGKKGGQALRHMLPAVRHKDPLNPDGALVYWDFGDDLAERLAALGIPAKEALRANFYAPQDIFCLDDNGAQQRYRANLKRLGPAGVFLYNSVVFVAGRG